MCSVLDILENIRNLQLVYILFFLQVPVVPEVLCFLVFHQVPRKTETQQLLQIRDLYSLNYVLNVNNLGKYLQLSKVTMSIQFRSDVM